MSRTVFRTSLLALAAALSAPVTAAAHFPFLSLNADGTELRATFGEGADADDPKYLPILQRAAYARHAPGAGAAPLELKPDGGALTADVSADPAGTVYTLALTYGVRGAGDDAFLLIYDAAATKGGTGGGTPADRPAALIAQPLALVAGPGKTITALAAGEPVPGATINVLGDLGGEDYEANGAGVVTLSAEEIADAGVMSVRTNLTLPGAGVYEGTSYPETRRYATAVFSAQDFSRPEAPMKDAAAGEPISVAPVPGAELPVGVTSLGAAVAGGYLYYYGGHPGTPHKYSTDEQSGDFRRLNLKDPAAGWEDLPGGPKLQGLALVPHPGGGVVRIGGFTARNSLDEEHDLHSMPAVAHYDPARGEWIDLPPLPGGRSSFDAVTLGNRVYVLGGWMMAGAEGEAWHGTGYTADLTLDPDSDDWEWETLPTPPQPRRANAVAAVPGAGGAGVIYQIGGMTPAGETTRRVDLYDVATKTWTRGPDLGGDSMDGFGAAAHAANGAVYVTTLTGLVQRHTPGADAWEDLGELENARFFHRLLPVPGEGGAPAFYLLGGGSMEVGRFTTVERLTVAP